MKNNGVYETMCTYSKIVNIYKEQFVARIIFQGQGYFKRFCDLDKF